MNTYNSNEKMFSFSTTTAVAATLSPRSSSAAAVEVEATTLSIATAKATSLTNSLKMPQTGSCLVTSAPQTPTISYAYEQHQQQQNFPVTNESTININTNNNNNNNNQNTTNDPYATYTDNFDLSLLPQDYNNIIATTTTTTTNPTNLIDNIPTTVFNFDTTATTTTVQQQQQDTNLLSVPVIKIEQTWSSCPSLITIKQEQIYQSYFPLNSQQNQLIPPPPAYPSHIYPSPQSSPAQSEYSFPHTQFSCSSSSSSTGCYESLSSSRNSLYNAASSPCPSIDVQTIKQEQLHILPPSPPESSCDTPTPQSGYSSCSSGFDFKSEPFDSDVETFNDLTKSHQDHQLLREYLEDTSFQKKHNLKPLALESFIGGLEEVRDNIEPVISLALEHAKREADATCAKLQISQDPSAWSTNQVHAWLRSTLQQYEFPIVENIENIFNENGAELLQLTEDEFMKRIPECGSTLHAQLEIWKLTYSPEYPKNTNTMQHQQNIWTVNTMHAYSNGMEEDTEEDDDFPHANNANNTITIHPTLNNTNGHIANNTNEVVGPNVNIEGAPIVPPVKRAGARSGGSHIHLWQFLKELLAAPHINGTAIRWIDRSKGIFKIEDSVRVAKLWGKRKNRPAMNYDKLSRSIRQYYKKGIMKKTERSQRLVYQFCQPYHM